MFKWRLGALLFWMFEETFQHPNVKTLVNTFHAPKQFIHITWGVFSQVMRNRFQKSESKSFAFGLNNLSTVAWNREMNLWIHLGEIPMSILL